MKVLILSTNKDFLKLLEDNMDGFELAVRNMSAEKSTLKKVIEEEKADIIILDAAMPFVIDGLDCLIVCTHIEQWTTAPIILLTSRSADVGEVIEVNFRPDDRWLNKPIPVSLIKKRIERITVDRTHHRRYIAP